MAAADALPARSISEDSEAASSNRESPLEADTKPMTNHRSYKEAEA